MSDESSSSPERPEFKEPVSLEDALTHMSDAMSEAIAEVREATVDALYESRARVERLSDELCETQGDLAEFTDMEDWLRALVREVEGKRMDGLSPAATLEWLVAMLSTEQGLHAPSSV